MRAEARATTYLRWLLTTKPLKCPVCPLVWSCELLSEPCTLHVPCGDLGSRAEAGQKCFLPVAWGHEAGFLPCHLPQPPLRPVWLLPQSLGTSSTAQAALPLVATGYWHQFKLCLGETRVPRQPRRHPPAAGRSAPHGPLCPWLGRPVGRVPLTLTADTKAGSLSSCSLVGPVAPTSWAQHLLSSCSVSGAVCGGAGGESTSAPVHLC